MHETHSPRRRFISRLLAALSLLIPGVTVAATAPRRRSPTPQLPSVGRRYVTGLDATGKSSIVDVGDVPASARWEGAGSKGYDFWVVPKLPAPLQELGNPPAGWTPVNRAPRGGVIGRLITWAPGFQYPMHTTPTLDFIFVLSGQLELGLERGTQLLGPGDVLVQRATAHRWRNPGSEPCTFVGIMIDAAHP